MPTVDLMGGKLQIYQRGTSRFWQARTSIDGKQRQFSTRREAQEQASKAAEDWYLTLHGKFRAGVLDKGPTFSKAAEQFLKEYGVITEGERSKKWTESHAMRLRVHLIPFFGAIPLDKVTPGKVQEYRVHRMTAYNEPNPASKSQHQPKNKPPARSTLHDEIVTLRLVLKTAIRHGWLEHLPDLSPPYKSQGKVVHRPWSALWNISNSMRRPVLTRASHSMTITNGTPSRSTTSCCSWRTPAFGRMKLSISSTAT